MPTLREKLIAGLEYSGWTEVETRSGKYRAFTHPEHHNGRGKPILYFVGKSGALRAGTTASDSFSLEGPNRDRILHRGEIALREKSNA